MVYVNAVESGGETLFQHLDKLFVLRPEFGLAWNNLHEDGSPNRKTLHEAMPLDLGSKWVIEKWSLGRTRRNGWLEELIRRGDVLIRLERKAY